MESADAEFGVRTTTGTTDNYAGDRPGLPYAGDGIPGATVTRPQAICPSAASRALLNRIGNQSCGRARIQDSNNSVACVVI